ncbi:MAG: hypothetical protein P8Y48_16850 [Novosphingobium sp.]
MESRSAADGDRHYTNVRDAGPGNMTARPRSRSETDEARDESFPASDPPAGY